MESTKDVEKIEIGIQTGYDEDGKETVRALKDSMILDNYQQKCKFIHKFISSNILRNFIVTKVVINREDLQ